MNWKILAGSVVMFVPLFWVLAQGFGVNPHAVPFVLQGQVAPDFKLTTLEGESYQLSDFKGKPVVINFWSTWCEPCKEEHDVLQKMSQTYTGSVQFLGIVYQDESEPVKRYLEVKGSRFPQLLDPDTRVGMDYGVSGVPESFFIDSKGRIRVKHAGVVTPQLLITQLRSLLSEAAMAGDE